ncbi:hypothetical protein EYF80_049288 [Liparis tanakae]|uniref:Uncharacterized protein n=1 Tax=Liparis tanakae TaxID=230148 RepID=A0A4Z2FH97_9TELE|nr:hypothetical protein EYF80_049288 [Liparis tanakae]
MAMIMKMTGGGGNKCDDDNEDDASGGGDADHSNGDDEGEMIIVLQHTIVASDGTTNINKEVSRASSPTPKRNPPQPSSQTSPIRGYQASPFAGEVPKSYIVKQGDKDSPVSSCSHQNRKTGGTPRRQPHNGGSPDAPIKVILRPSWHLLASPRGQREPALLGDTGRVSWVRAHLADCQRAQVLREGKEDYKLAFINQPIDRDNVPKDLW